MALWFNSETGMLMTEWDIVNDYAVFIQETVKQNGIEFILQRPEDFTLESWINGEASVNCTLHPVMNAEKFTTV